MGIPAGTPVALGSNDQLNGAVGVGNVRPGLGSATIGTAMALVATLEQPPADSHSGLLWGCHPVPDLYYVLSYAKNSGILLTWWRDLRGQTTDYTSLLEEAAQVSPGADGLVCLPHFSGTATPSFRSDVRGGFVGLTLAHGRGHITRCLAETVCFLARDVVELLRGSGYDVEALRVLGGAAASPWWMQLLSDVLQRPLEIPRCQEAAVLGGAIFAGVATGAYSSVAEAATEMYRTEATFTPRPALAETYAAAYSRYRETHDLLYPGALGEARTEAPA
jgi:xylulokinase